MKLPFVRRPKTIFDFEHVVDRFCDNLLELRDHLVDHDLTMDTDQMEAEIDKVVCLLQSDQHWIDPLMPEEIWETESQNWINAWETVRDSMKGWWD